MKVKVLPTALDDLEWGRRFYDRQGETLGDYFFDSLFADVDSLALYAGIHPVFYGFHRKLANRFPYAIYYRVVGDTALVFRILDCRSNPKTIRRALGTGRFRS